LFPIKAKKDVPVSKIVIHSVAVRGALGPLTVWVSKENAVHVAAADAATRHNTHRGRRQGARPPAANPPALPHQQQQQQPETNLHNFPLTARYWTKVYEQVHAPSMRTYRLLDFSANPVILVPGQVRALYIHSSLPGDEAIVYDNASHNPRAFMGPIQRRRPTPRYEDAFVQVHAGKAHLSPRPFGQTPIWGWGNAWRDHREFVGQVSYGVIYQLWQPNPSLHGRFGPRFHEAVRAVLACQRRVTSPVALLPDECLYYILNMCRWDWFADGPDALKEQRRQRERAARERALTRAEEEPATEPVSAVAAPVDPYDAPAPLCQASAATVQPMEGLSVHDGNRNTSTTTNNNNNNNNNSEEQQHADTEMNEVQEEDPSSEESSVEDEWQDDNEDDDVDDEEEDDDDSSDWERQHGYRADVDALRYHDISSDEEEGEDPDETDVAERGRLAWVRRHYARAHILRALAQAENGDVVVVDNMMESDDDDDADDNDSDGHIVD
jgi:hypothetical protein